MPPPAENLLKYETSPYLLQHKDNPVHWRAWGPEALAEAHETDRPILLSVGYAACHWCHVMAHESFEDPNTAAVMNHLFVNIKVDREERPDIDGIYQSALALLGEQGGWPLTMFLTPAGQPFWGGTYFPPTQRWGRAGFTDVLEAIARTYREAPDRVAHNTQALQDGLDRLASPKPGAAISRDFADRTARQLLEAVDMKNGGIGGAPKFPQPSILRQLWSASRRSEDPETADHLRRAVLLTLNRICEGGIYDHLGGGFARYAVDEHWLVPHFEKMLYDNAQLLELLALAWLDTGDPLFRRRAEETVTWILSDMITPEGAFAAARDADSEGEEGKFYVWTQSEIETILDPDEAALFMQVYDVSPTGNWEGKTILNRLRWTGTLSAEAENRIAACRAKLLDIRAQRPPPMKDDKVLADWNGMMIAALAFTAPLFNKPNWLDAARAAFDFIAGPMANGPRLRHSFRAGEAKIDAPLEDYAAMIRAALALSETTGERSYVEKASAWADILLDQYADTEGGGFLQTADDAETLIIRAKSAMDNATPSGNGQLVALLTKLFWITGDKRYHNAAEATVRAFAGETERNFYPYSNLIEGAMMMAEGVQIAIIGPPDDDATQRLLAAARSVPLADRLLMTIDPTESIPEASPLHGKTMVDGNAAAYICRGPVCSPPITDAGALHAALS